MDAAHQRGVLTNRVDGGYASNLAALAERQPDVARVVERTPIPAGVREATGRDGQPTFRVPGPNGRLAWFGASSMPSVSAPEIVGACRGDGRNVTLPGILTGVEPLLILGMIPSHAAVFVLEPEPLHIRLAFRLYDYSSAMRDGRLVFVLDEPADLTRGLRDFFERHPGYELPPLLLPVPQRAPVRVAELQSRIERAGREVAELQGRLVAQRRDRLRRRRLRPPPERPNVALLSVDPRGPALEQARRIGRALDELACPYALGLPDSPEKCHVLARLQAIEEVSADLALFLSAGAAAMSDVLPEGLPVATWHLPGAALRQEAPGQRGARGDVWVSSRSQFEVLVGAGVPEGVIHWAPPAAEAAIAAPRRLDGQPGTRPGFEVAVLADLPDDRAEGCGITLPSHVRLWEALRSRVRESVDRYSSAQGQGWLADAEKRSGTALREISVRNRFLELLRARLLPVARAAADVAVLQRLGCRVALWGPNWPAELAADASRRGTIGLGRGSLDALASSRIVVFADASALSIQGALDAIASGATTIVRNTLDRPFEEEYPGLAEVATHLHLYDTAHALAGIVHALRANHGEGSGQGAARELVLRRHLVAHRLRTIFELIRANRGALAAAT